MAQGILDSLNDLKVNLQIPDKVQLPGSTTSVDLRRVDKTIDSATDTLFHASVAMLMIMGGWLISRWLASTMQRALVRAHVELTVAAFVGSLARYGFFLVCAIGAFRVLGVSLTSMVAVFGAIGLAVAFALRNTLSHVAAGLMLIVNRPFRVGDFIELANVMGTVKRITLFNTEINTLQNQRMFIPNSLIWEGVLQNHTYNEVRVVDLKVGFSYADKPEACKKMLREVFAANELVLTKPEPYIETVAYRDSDILYGFRIAVRTRDYGAVRSVILDQVWHGAKKAGITIPFPTRTVQIEQATAAPLPRARKRK